MATTRGKSYNYLPLIFFFNEIAETLDIKGKKSTILNCGGLREIRLNYWNYFQLTQFGLSSFLNKNTSILNHSNVYLTFKVS